MRRNVEKIRRHLAKYPRVLILPLFVLLLAATIVPQSLALNVVTATDAGGTVHQVVANSQSSPQEILAQTGFASVQMQGESFHREQNREIQAQVAPLAVVNRIYQVEVYVDDQVLRETAVTGTVADILERFSVELGEYDAVEPQLTTEITDDTTIYIHRVSYSEEQVRSNVLAELVDDYEQRLAQNDPNTGFTRSRSGIYDVTYRHTLVNGEIAQSEVIDLTPVLTPNDEANTEFVDGEAVSTIDRFEGVELDENGIPLNYSRKISGAVATAYSSSGGRGASGLGLYCGTVAVNPNEIPYGTKLYIAAADGGFVYGFAIASDTGTAMMEGRVDIDLYFESNAECYMFGKRTLDVYVLE